jgi:hypothetical protein
LRGGTLRAHRRAQEVVMRKLLLAGGVVVALGLPGAALAFGPSDNPQAVHACADTARRQFEGGVTPINRGHGVIGHPATNCDHFWQAIGVIGNGVPGGNGPR